jgi:hypothetical protein
MLAKPSSRLDEIARDEIAKLGWCAVCLIGNDTRVPRHFGDNEGGLALRTVVTKEPWTSTRVDAQRNPWHQIAAHVTAWFESRKIAELFEAQLSKTLQKYSTPLHHSWVGLVIDFDMSMIDLVIYEAAEAAGVSIRSHDEWLRAVATRIAARRSREAKGK